MKKAAKHTNSEFGQSGPNFVLFGYFSRVFGDRESISGFKRAKYSARAKMGLKPVERKKMQKKITRLNESWPKFLQRIHINDS